MYLNGDFRDREDAKRLALAIKCLKVPGVNIMEVCGTHTMAIACGGIKQMLPENVRLISGPGCPVCVTPPESIDLICSLSMKKDVIVATYGDMIRVPGTRRSISLERSRMLGADVRVVYSSMDALDIAVHNLCKKVVFLGIGFETTAPATAAAIKTAKEKGIDNFSVFNLHKRVEPVLRRLLDCKEVKIDGFLLPGHVAAVVGEREFEFLEDEYGIPGVIAGFEPCDILKSIYMLLKQMVNGRCKVENEYTRIVSFRGNIMAQKAIDEVFEPCSDRWRGLGVIESGGMRIKREYSKFDAACKMEPEANNEVSNTKCRCGDILKGLIEPYECELFGTCCTPYYPVGPCMVSSEGACAAAYKYR